MAKAIPLIALGTALTAIGAKAGAEGIAYQTSYDSGKDTTLNIQGQTPSGPQKIATRVFASERPGYEGVLFTYEFYDNLRFREKDTNTWFSVGSFYNPSNDGNWGAMEQKMAEAGPMRNGNNFDAMLRSVYGDLIVDLKKQLATQAQTKESPKPNALETTVNGSPKPQASAEPYVSDHQKQLKFQMELEEQLSKSATRIVEASKPSVSDPYVSDYRSRNSHSGLDTALPKIPNPKAEPAKTREETVEDKYLAGKDNQNKDTRTNEQELADLMKQSPRSENTMDMTQRQRQLIVPPTEEELARLAQNKRQELVDVYSRFYIPEFKYDLPIASKPISVHEEGGLDEKVTNTEKPTAKPKEKPKFYFGLTGGSTFSTGNTPLGAKAGVRIGIENIQVGIMGGYQKGFDATTTSTSEPAHGVYGVGTVTDTGIHSVGLEGAVYFGDTRAMAVFGAGAYKNSATETTSSEIRRVTDNSLASGPNFSLPEKMTSTSVKGYMGVDFGVGKKKNLRVGGLIGVFYNLKSKVANFFGEATLTYPLTK